MDHKAEALEIKLVTREKWLSDAEWESYKAPWLVDSLVDWIAEALVDLHDQAQAASDRDAEIGRLRAIMFTAADCDPEQHRDGFVDEHDCWHCGFWESDRCSIDGWEPPE